MAVVPKPVPPGLEAPSRAGFLHPAVGIIRSICKSVHYTGRCFFRGGDGTMNPFHRAIYLTGPTASGKTAVGVAPAGRLDAEVIALDSMTLYRGMDIGTAKPTAEERGGIPHHLIDVLDPWESASVAEYRQWGLRALEEIEARGK